jgi:uncharacterized cupin superfamily protein
MATHRPALEALSVAAVNRSGYPEPWRSRVLPRERRRLGDAFALTRVGINLTTLPPGKESSMRHWHTREDEFVYVLEGEVVLCTGAGEQRLTAGMCAGFPQPAARARPVHAPRWVGLLTRVASFRRDGRP